MRLNDATDHPPTTRHLAVPIRRHGHGHSLSDTVDQLQEQLHAAQQQIGAERNQHALTEAQLRQENATLTRELAEVRLELRAIVIVYLCRR